MVKTSKSKESRLDGKAKMLLFGVFVLLVTVWGLLFDVKVSPSARLSSLRPGFGPVPTAASPTVESLSEQVVPVEGYYVDIEWGDVGRKLVEAGGIDIEKFNENYSGEEYQELLTFLTQHKKEGIRINRENAYFWVNTLWALGLTQKSDVLDKGVMGTEYKDRVENFASTGGWTLGVKDSKSLYSSTELISLNQEQQDLVARVSENIYRPCCGNPVSFPDCNHGMAILGLLELMAGQGKSEEEMYEASLAFNSYWFTQTYVDLAYYFQSTEGVSWGDIDPKRMLSAEFSSSPGYLAIKKKIGNIPGAPSGGASCGA